MAAVADMRMVSLPRRNRRSASRISGSSRNWKLRAPTTELAQSVPTPALDHEAACRQRNTFDRQREPRYVRGARINGEILAVENWWTMLAAVSLVVKPSWGADHVSIIDLCNEGNACVAKLACVPSLKATLVLLSIHQWTGKINSTRLLVGLREIQQSHRINLSCSYTISKSQPHVYFTLDLARMASLEVCHAWTLIWCFGKCFNLLH